MGFLDRLLGRQPRDEQQPSWQQTGGYEPPSIPSQRGHGMPSVDQAVASEDERAIARYRYLLRTAPPERLEEVHAEAFAQLSPDQRQQVLGRLSQDLPEGEAPRSDDPRDLARAATRAEMRQPGYMGSAFAGPGFGTVMAGSMLGTIAGFAIGSSIAGAMLGGYETSPEAGDVGDQVDDAGGDPGVGGEGAGYETSTGHAEPDGGFFDGGDFGGFDF